MVADVRAAVVVLLALVIAVAGPTPLVRAVLSRTTIGAAAVGEGDVLALAVEADVIRAIVAVVAVHLLTDALPILAAIVGTGVAVIAVHGSAGASSVLLATVLDSAGIAVVAALTDQHGVAAAGCGLAGILGANVVVVAALRCPLAFTILVALVVLRTLVAVVALPADVDRIDAPETRVARINGAGIAVGATQRSSVAVSLRVARILHCAGGTVVTRLTGESCMAATRLNVTGILGTTVVVVAIDRLAGAAVILTEVIRGARVAVIAGRSLQ